VERSVPGHTSRRVRVLWSTISDRNAKANFLSIDPIVAAAKTGGNARLNLELQSFVNSIRHLGPHEASASVKTTSTSPLALIIFHVNLIQSLPYLNSFFFPTATEQNWALVLKQLRTDCGFARH
jgi:hypothetical protein